MKLYTIGFTKKSAEEFFTTLQHSGAARLIDVRLNNSSQLAGFSKRDDLKYFLKAICGIDYLHLPELAPTQELLDEYRDTKNWPAYERKFLALMAERKVDRTLEQATFNGACLLCSESTADKCHRRLVAEFLRDRWGEIEIVHL